MATQQHSETGHVMVRSSGEIDFPLWMKAVSWFLGIVSPIALLTGVWVTSAIFDMSIKLAAIEAALDVAADDRYRASQATAAHEALQVQLEENRRQIRELQTFHGRVP